MRTDCEHAAGMVSVTYKPVAGMSSAAPLSIAELSRTNHMSVAGMSSTDPVRAAGVSSRVSGDSLRLPPCCLGQDPRQRLRNILVLNYLNMFREIITDSEC